MGNIKTFSVTLDKEVVAEARKYMKKYGGKISPMVNEFLINWIKKEKAKRGGKS